MPRIAKDYTGYEYSYLTVLRKADAKSRWIVRCECGAEKEVDIHDVLKREKQGKPVSCGCMRRKLISEANTHHGMSKHPAFAVWRSMLARCMNPMHRAWKNYGWRGITVCERWQKSFEQFWIDMGPTYEAGLDLDRIDNEKGYSPDNCRWVSRTVNNRNKRGARRVELNGTTWDLKELAEVSGVKYTTLLYRLDHDCALEHLLDPPDVTRKFSTL